MLYDPLFSGGTALFFLILYHKIGPHVDYDSWLRISQQYLSCALVRGRGIVFRYYCQSMAKSGGKDLRDGAVLPFE